MFKILLMTMALEQERRQKVVEQNAKFNVNQNACFSLKKN